MDVWAYMAASPPQMSCEKNPHLDLQFHFNTPSLRENIQTTAGRVPPPVVTTFRFIV